MNPDDRATRYGAHVFSVENIDLSDYGMPGFSFTGDLHIEPDDTPGVLDWCIADICALSGCAVTTFQGFVVRKAVMADKRLCEWITEACIEHGEG